jgi:hypothetical protein
MLFTGTFPTLLKFSQILPIYKNGNRADISPYRPVSLLTSSSIIDLLQHTEGNNILTSDLYGFKKNSSTEVAIFNLTNHILSQINKKSSVCGIFCDLTKAFDTVNHDILMTKLQYYGIVGKFGELIKPYLNNRYQRVIIKSLYTSNHVSSWKLVKHGISQGSILRPLLFLFYINDLSQLVKGKALPVLFADDTSFIISNSDLAIMDQDVKVVLQIAQRWFNSNRMLLNYNNTKFMQFFPNISHHPLDTIKINTCKINFTNSPKFWVS